MTCAKRKVTCVILATDGSALRRSNDCENPQPVCPREPGEGYEKCKSICGQMGHAEVQAVNAGKLTGFPFEGATAHIYGHYWACEPCARALNDAGVTKLVIHQFREG